MPDTYLQFKRPGRACQLCGASLPELERHPSVLRADDKEEFLREDICPTCWEKMTEKAYFSYWITKRYQSGPTPEERKLAKAERNEALWALFNALYAREDRDALQPQLFLAAHLLMKYRILQYVGPTQPGRLEFTHPQTRESFLIDDLPLDSVSFVDVMQVVDGQLREYAPRVAGDSEDPPAGDEDGFSS